MKTGETSDSQPEAELKNFEPTERHVASKSRAIGLSFEIGVSYPNMQVFHFRCFILYLGEACGGIPSRMTMVKPASSQEQMKRSVDYSSLFPIKLLYVIRKTIDNEFSLNLRLITSRSFQNLKKKLKFDRLHWEPPLKKLQNLREVDLHAICEIFPRRSHRLLIDNCSMLTTLDLQ